MIKSKKRAFTLVEIVIALTLAAIVIYPLLDIFISPLTQNPRLEALGMALHLANAKLESVSNLTFTSITSESQTAFDSNFSDFNYEVEVHYVTAASLETFVSSTESYKWIKVRITSVNLPVSGVELTTLVSDKSNE